MSRKTVFFLIIILTLAAFFRLWQIDNIPSGLYPDEAMNGNNALEVLHSGQYKVFYPENNGREGLYINLVALSIKVFGNQPWAIRIVSTIFGILTVLGLYLLTRELFKKDSIALFASFFIAASFWHINFSRIGFRAIMAPFFLVWSLWLLFLVLRKAHEMKILGGGAPNFAKQNLALRNFQIACLALFSGLLFGLGFYSYIAYRIAPLLLIPPFLILIRNKDYKTILMFLSGALIAVLPLAIYFINNPYDFFGRTSQISILSSESPLLAFGKNIILTIGMFFVKGDSNWRHNFAGAPQLWWPIAILFLLGILISLKEIIKNAKYSFFNSISGFLILWLIIMLLPVVISSEGLPHALRAIIVIPPVMIFTALGLDWLIEKTKRWIDKKTTAVPEATKQLLRIKKELTILIFAFLFTVSLYTFTQYFLKWSINPNVFFAFNENYAQIGRYIKSSQQNIKKYVIINADGVDVRGVPMPSQTVMFITDTFLPEMQKEKKIFYITTQNLDGFIEIARNENNLQIFMLENDPYLRKKLSDNIPGLFSYEDSGLLIQAK